MSLINLTYFVRDIKISNLNKAENIIALQQYIDTCEQELLIRILGYSFYSKLVAQAPEQRFLDVIAGKDFSFAFQGKTRERKWIGLTNDLKESPIAYYTYFHYMKDHDSANTPIGVVREKVENGVQVANIDKPVNAIKKAADLIGGFQMPHGFSSDPSDFDYYDDEGSLYNFLLTNRDLYPEWEFKPIRKINVIFGS